MLIQKKPIFVLKYRDKQVSVYNNKQSLKIFKAKIGLNTKELKNHLFNKPLFLTDISHRPKKPPKTPN